MGFLQGCSDYSQSPSTMKLQSAPSSRGPVLSSWYLNPFQKTSQFQSFDSRKFAQEPLGSQQKQLMQGPVKPLDTGGFPSFQRCKALAVNFQLRQPVTPSSVAVQCSENRVFVEPSGLSMGGCPVVSEDSASGVLIFEYELQDCNIVLMMTQNEVVYTFALTYTPVAFDGTPINHAKGALVGVQCHYQRFFNVSSNAFKPTWVPYASAEVGEDFLLFFLNLMTGLKKITQLPQSTFIVSDIYSLLDTLFFLFFYLRRLQTPMTGYNTLKIFTPEQILMNRSLVTFLETQACFV
uniref:ZP domain-containing protein n=1 Tax=Cyprinus carpio TaxID=7962 RepID=A0A8C2IMC9_CYPCA